MEFYKTLRNIMERKHLTISDVTRACDLTDSTVRSIFDRQQKKVALNIAFKLSKGLGVSLEELNGDVSLTNKQHLKCNGYIKKYESLDNYGKSIVDDILERELIRMQNFEMIPKRSNKTIQIEAGQKSASKKYNHDEIGDAQYISLRYSLRSASAGTGTYLGPEEFENISVLENELTRKASFGVPVSGDSMEPTYHNGDILIVGHERNLQLGDIGIFTIDGNGYVKKLGKNELISINPNYKPIKMNNSIICNGKVIGVLDPEWIQN